MNKISITVCTYNRRQLLSDVISALLNQNIKSSDYEIVICDSHSNDGTAEMIVELQKSSDVPLHHVHTKNNLAAKRNLGIATAVHPLVIFLDDDCVPDDRFIAAYFEKFSTVAVGTRVVYCGEVRYPHAWTSHSNYYRFRDSRHFGRGNGLPAFDRLNFKTIVVMNMCFEKELFIKTVGTVNENFIGYGAEDQELGWRLEEVGYSILPCDARIFHHETTGSIDAYGSKIRRASRDGMQTLIRINHVAAYSMTALKKLDVQFPSRSMYDRFVFNTVKLFYLSRFHHLVEWLLNTTDTMPLFYIPKLYRMLMGVYYVQGVHERGSRLTAEQAEKSWES